MDLDALLARRPQLALVDELAHDNAPGSRHPKRWQDVEELLAAGIDVWTTMNVQHVESLNDVVAQITHVRVRETVPDSVLDQAEIELVDLTPDELRERLHEGKVYVPEQARRALDHYFSPGNLTALRELALRRTAERVDDQMVQYMRAHGLAGPWAASEHLLVCVHGGEGAAELVRYTKRLADRLKAPWTAIHIQTAGDRRAGEAVNDRVADTLRLAERLGGEALALPGAADRRRGAGLGARQQRHADHHRQRQALGLARPARRLAAARPDPRGRRHHDPGAARGRRDRPAQAGAGAACRQGDRAGAVPGRGTAGRRRDRRRLAAAGGGEPRQYRAGVRAAGAGGLPRLWPVAGARGRGGGDLRLQLLLPRSRSTRCRSRSRRTSPACCCSRSWR